MAIVRTLADSGFFKNFLYQGGVKSTETSKDFIPSIMHTTVAACTQPKWPNQVVFIVVNLTPPNSEIICGQNVGAKVVCGIIFFFEKKALLQTTFVPTFWPHIISELGGVI